ncbi:hypothetical protein PG993_006967 [Apiospora rasikravindrae]|uniref:DUF6536 domain-containing protein n=1 Tax=Apiospora rasikravindrae TaxID=990691 RepID=A0ABR1SXI2_9PEZI
MAFFAMQRDKKWFTGRFQSLRSTGWRRTGAWNVLAASTAGIVILCSLLVSVSQPDSSLRNDTVLFHGSCDYSRNLNIGLHLLINLVSSAVLASSNYFMQILNAPSRHEVNQAHRVLSSLDIGIPSVKNLIFVSGRKRWFWMLILITSWPIHLFFNSSIYETKVAGSTWQLTIAAESFLHGSPFFPPGASLAAAGSPSPIDYNSTANIPETGLGSYWRTSYGDSTNLSEYWDDSSPTRRKLSQISRDVKKGEQDGLWKRLESKDCRQEYCFLKPREKYGDVVVVVKAGANTTGWTRTEVYADPHNRLPEWSNRLPPHDVNSLWYSTQCSHQRSLPDNLNEGYHTNLTNESPCTGALGSYWDAYYWIDYSEYKLKELENQEEWSILFKNWTGPAKALEEFVGYNSSFNGLEVEYCLADIAPSRGCKVIMANNLLLVTIICVCLKVIICTTVVGKLPDESLVTPGDVLDSFLSDPDSTTLGLGTYDIHDVYRMEFHLPCPLTLNISEESRGPSIPVPRARGWQPKRRRILSAIPRSAWWRAYAPILAALSFLSYFTANAYLGNENSFGGAFGDEDARLTVSTSPISYLGGLIVANIGQLVLSWCYFAYNALLTRIHVEKELNAYSRTFRPLRVSFPKGEQVVTWRLQLPYHFGIPLIVTSIILHWLASNSIFILIWEGGYWSNSTPTGSGSALSVDSRNHALAADSVVMVGYSPPAVLATLILVATLATVPLFVSLYKLPGDMVFGASNSLVLSALCHAVRPDRQAAYMIGGAAETDETPMIDETTETEPPPEHRSTYVGSMLEIGNQESDDGLVRLARSRLRWGVTPLTPELRDIVQETGQEALHLAFATEETFISPPVEGDLYL